MVTSHTKLAALLAMGCITLLTLSACGNNSEDENNATTPDMTVTPEPDMTVTPEPDMTVTPEPDMTVTPEPDMTVTPDPDMGLDMAVEVDMPAEEDMEEDIPTVGDLGGDTGGEPEDFACFDELKDGWPLNTSVATTQLTGLTEENGVYTATLDASAGGSMAAAGNPFIYLDLDTGAKVEIDDIASYTDTTWELAFKRVVIRTNGGTSGTGQTAVAKVDGTTFEAVTEAPEASSFVQDGSVNASCDVITDPIGNLYTAFNPLNEGNASGSQSWYNYVGGVSPTAGDIYIVRSADGSKTFKFEITSWSGGVFGLRWQEL